MAVFGLTPQFPNVPNVPGVPPVLRNPGAVASAGISLLSGDVFSAFARIFGPQWGIFFGGLPVVIADNVVSFDYRHDWSVSDYPLEQGAFASYDKVEQPFEVRVRFSTGGSILAREVFLASIDAIAGNMLIYSVATPEVIYPSCNITHYSYTRTSDRGAGLIVVDVWLRAIRVNAQQFFSSTQSPSGADPQSTGGVSPQDPTAAQQGAISAPGAVQYPPASLVS